MPHEVIGLGLPGVLATAAGLLIFFGSVYVLVALNTGWRFGYWVTFATLGGLMLFMSVFWWANPVGPRGEDPLWIPIAAEAGQIAEASFGGTNYQSPADYPNEPWREASDATVGGGALGFFRDVAGIRKDVADPLFLEVEPLTSAISNCLGFDERKVQEIDEEIEEKLPGWERTILEGKFQKKERLEREVEVCERTFSLLPDEGSLPQIDDMPVAVTYDTTEIRFTEENGTLLAGVVVVPNTYDPRLTGDDTGETAEPVGEPLRLIAYRDPGSLRYPATVYLVFWTAWFVFHLWGLSRAERRKLSTVV